MGLAQKYLALVLIAIVMFIGIYIVNQVISAFSLPTTGTVYTNETVALAANDTYVNFACQASCLSDPTVPTNCGVGTTGVTSVVNTTHTLPVANYAWTTNQIKIIDTGAGYVPGNWKVNYLCYDHSVSGAGSTYTNTRSTVWNSMTLAAVAMVTMAASFVIGGLFIR
jgi:hypothetical protein